MYNLSFRTSSDKYKVKPTSEDMADITNSIKKGKTMNTTYKNLALYLHWGYSVLLADIEGDDVRCENIKSISCLALDVDGKEKPIKMDDMIEKVYKKFGIIPIIRYCTFSDTDDTRFRLIYRLENPIDTECYKTLYKALQWKLGKYIDGATKNPNRIWAGTNKGVFYNEDDIPFSFVSMSKLINNYLAKLARDEAKNKVIIQGEYTKCSDKAYIKTDYKKEVTEYLIQNIDLRYFIQSHFGGEFKRLGDNYVGRCVFHGGDNPNALVISDRIYTCFTHCGTGNIITAARLFYKEEHFSSIALTLASEYNLTIPTEYLQEVK